MTLFFFEMLCSEWRPAENAMLIVDSLLSPNVHSLVVPLDHFSVFPISRISPPPLRTLSPLLISC